MHIMSSRAKAAHAPHPDNRNHPVRTCHPPPDSNRSTTARSNRVRLGAAPTSTTGIPNTNRNTSPSPGRPSPTNVNRRWNRTMFEPSPNTSRHRGSNNHDVHVATTGSHPKCARANPRARPNDSSTPTGSNPPEGMCNRSAASPDLIPGSSPASSSGPYHSTSPCRPSNAGSNCKPPTQNNRPRNCAATHAAVSTLNRPNIRRERATCTPTSASVAAVTDGSTPNAPCASNCASTRAANAHNDAARTRGSSAPTNVGQSRHTPTGRSASAHNRRYIHPTRCHNSGGHSPPAEPDPGHDASTSARSASANPNRSNTRAARSPTGTSRALTGSGNRSASSNHARTSAPRPNLFTTASLSMPTSWPNPPPHTSEASLTGGHSVDVTHRNHHTDRKRGPPPMPVPDPAHHVRDWIATYDTPTTSVAHLLCDRHNPHTTATTEIGPTLQATTLTFGELAERSRALAAGLSYLGITTGDRVATLIPKGIDLTVTALAVWRLGAVLVPLLSSYAPSAIAQRLTDSHARLIVCDAEYRTKLDPLPDDDTPTPHIATTGTDPLREGDHTLTALIRRGADTTPVPDAAVGGDGLLAIVHVSSVVGPPRGVRVPVRALAAMHAYHHYGLGVHDDDVYWNTADPGSAYGLYHGLISPLLAGHGSLALRAGFFDPELTLDVLGIHGVTNLAADPTTYRTLRAATKTLPPEVMVQSLASAGEPLSPDVIDWVTDVFGVPVRDHYGQTELGWCVGVPNGDTGQAPKDPAPGSVGPALPGWHVEVLEAISDDPAPPGSYGRVAVDLNRSPLAWFEGYDGNDSAAQVRFTPDRAYYLTGDTGIRDREGALYFSTRDDGAILTYGYRIGPTEVETALNDHPAVEECGVYSIPDELAGQVIGARVVLEAGRAATPELAEELRAWVGGRIAEHAAPRVVDFVDELPRTASGKMRRARLR